MREMTQQEIAALRTQDVVFVLVVRESGSKEYETHLIRCMLPNVDIASLDIEGWIGDPHDHEPILDRLEQKNLLQTLFYATTMFVDAGEGTASITIVGTKIPGKKSVLRVP